MPQTRYTYNRLNRRLSGLVRGRLWLQVMIAIALGACLGVLLGPDLQYVSRDVARTAGSWLALPGQLFLGLIKMVIVPLVVSSIIMGIAAAGANSDLKRIGVRLVFFVLITTMLGASIGAGFARLAKTGEDLSDVWPPFPVERPNYDPDAPKIKPIEEITRKLPDLITALVPENISVSILERDMLAIVVFAIFVGVAVVSAADRDVTKPLLGVCQAILEVSMTVIRTAMRMAPIAVFGLMAQTTADNGFSTLIDLAQYCGVVLAGLFVLLLVYLVIVAVLGGITPWRFIAAVAPAQLLAFSTSSSAAVMPLTMKTAVEKLGVSASLAGAVVPLASTINMAGTALYQSAAIVFLANLGNISMSWSDIALIMITLTGASIGAPAAPGASIAILSSTAASFGIPLIGLPLILGVDRLLDMARTSVNVTGDLVLCRILRGFEVEQPPQEQIISPAAEQAVPSEPKA